MKTSYNKLLKQLSCLLIAGLILFSNPVLSAATFIIQIDDAPGEGFNDPTPATPVDGNPGVTVGEQRLALFERAGEIWGATINSTVPITISAQFNPLDCSEDGTSLGFGGTLTIHSNFVNAPVADTLYGQALANSLAGVDLDLATADLSIRFNSDIDNGCLDGTVGWYYGFDGVVPPNQIALLPILLHEFGHGLGFQSFTNSESGEFFLGMPDIWSDFIFDLDAGATWRNLPNDAARAASATNDPNLVWNGANVNAAFADVLSISVQLTVNSPAIIAGEKPIQVASFGPAVPDAGITANVILVDDSSGTTTDGCEAISNDLTGAIALIDRGGCNFTAKVINAQTAGAIGVLIANNETTGLAPVGGADPAVMIPSLGVSMALGTDIQAQLLLGAVNVSMEYDLSTFAGTSGGFVRLYAPDPFSPSSVSHWTPDTLPNLLMEPNATASIFDELDLTRELFMDIGWSVAPVVVAPDLIFANDFE